MNQDVFIVTVKGIVKMFLVETHAEFSYFF